MKIVRMVIATAALMCLSACGAGKFFIERAVVGIEQDIAKEIKDLAKFDSAQQAQIDEIAKLTANWVKGDRLRLLSGELDNIADDVARGSSISRNTWDTTVAFIERPFTMSSVPGLVDRIGAFCYKLTDAQADSVMQKLAKRHKEDAKEYAKQSLSEQNKKFARGLKIVFAEMGIRRSKQQMSVAQDMLAQRQSHIDLEWQEEQRNHQVFMELIENRTGSQADYLARFKQAWANAEQGAKYRAPELWEHNAEVAFGVMNYLLQDLSLEQRDMAASNIREYSALFKQLAQPAL